MSMKITELMLGDWVLDIRTNNPLRVNPFMADMEVPEWQPIPLTPEILEKNNILYEKPSFYYVIKDDKDLDCTYYMQQVLQGDWVVGIDKGAYNCIAFARMKYVHELQHILKVCKIDKDIIV